MKISTKGKYGLLALMDICLYSQNEIVTVKSICEREKISERYLEQIFSTLRKSGIIKAKKGAQGGYFLTRDAKDFTIGEILSVLEGDLLVIDIERDENKIQNFLIDNLWDEINSLIADYFNNITLQELADGYMTKENDNMYYI